MSSVRDYYINQAGGGGSGRGDFNIVVRPRRIQQGAGVLSNLLRRGFDFIKPILFNAAKTVGYEGLNFGNNILSNMGKNKPFSEIVKNSADESLNNLKNKLVGKLSQFGSGRKRILALPQDYEGGGKRRKVQSSSKPRRKQKRKKGKAKKKKTTKKTKKKTTKKTTKKKGKKKKKKAAKKSKKKGKRRVKDIFD